MYRHGTLGKGREGVAEKTTFYQNLMVSTKAKFNSFSRLLQNVPGKC